MVKPDPHVELHLLLEEAQEETARWRLRTIFLLSIFFHLGLLTVLYALSGYIRHQNQLAVLEAESKPPEPMFLYLPRELVKPPQKPKTPVLSDQDRLAQGKAPVVKPEAPALPYSKGNTPLPEVAGGGGKQAPQPPPRPAQPTPAPAGGGQHPAPPAPKQQSEDALKMEDVPKPASSPTHLAMATPEEAIQQSLRAAAEGRASGQIPGAGESTGQFNNPNSNFSIGGVQVLSDTQGVDFGPYLARVIRIVRQNWYNQMPEAARLGQKGRVQLDFQILKDGKVPSPQPFTSASSGMASLDEAAASAIHLSNPFPPLPSEFKGDDLKLRFIFLYNLGFGPE